MNILAIDTSTDVMGVSLLDENRVLAEVTTNLKKNHSIRLMPTIEQLFEEVKWEPKAIDLIAVAKGPGSYTGVRIGITTAKTMAWALKIPLIGVSTLEAMAYPHQNFTGLISPIIDARRGRVYTGLYKKVENKWTNVESDQITPLSKWLNLLQQTQEAVLFVGDDVELHHENIYQELGDMVSFSSSAFNIPRPSVIGLIAKERYLNGKRDDIYDFSPSYLQLAEAEAKWLEKQKINKG
ncbi:tRNA (adenosine(37)-N6)-threonylcarbamoyltransferase complex dimerization subunit type 1 TsaB [Vulcanibacillus modesticaldus]|uniref:tRNA (Adenosine(37)-N6)-threonylcarbamoyltransferase complex dimerization subunit type 1 TsaB n=1 Tax=Vulcanibacillus modesticaldus TaxID=337097 RepID=A0A1D2YXC0_9BACI|nr:tRNA (adenosine(37)-N6)-threonylcarbamoyltransferase complex dimerization subunit type 1 TsaB [Vulcanibacillus modesticaldus]OEG00257.1 tRNA (adenosine(37)-N6)-threonylcarbamoyltransferase complex dimerization subunit type 1 TsaB [Vulcanibacillus modesticaldus]